MFKHSQTAEVPKKSKCIIKTKFSILKYLFNVEARLGFGQTQFSQ